MQLLERGRTKRQIKENLTIKREGDQKYFIFWSPNKRAHTSWDKRGEEKRKRKKKKKKKRKNEESSKSMDSSTILYKNYLGMDC